MPSILSLEQAIESAIQWCISNQHSDGYWLGQTDSNCCMEAEWILFNHILGIDNRDMRDGVVKAILHEQRDDGSWEIYYNAPKGDINTTVECYAALRVAGLSPDSQPLKRARQWIHANGGMKQIRVFTRYWLAMIGVWPWEHTPNMPPEIILLPYWAPFSIYRFASWARSTIIPLSLLCASRVVRPIPSGSRLDELFIEGRENFDFALPCSGSNSPIEKIFYKIDRLFHRYQQRLPSNPLRRKGIEACVRWIEEHQDWDGSWGGIQPPTIYSILALKEMGYALDHPAIKKGIEAFQNHWSRRKQDRIYINITESIVWDTMLTLIALLDCGVNPVNSPSFQNGLQWFLSKAIHEPGDWSIYLKGVKPCAWAFERANRWYPDLDDTAVALMLLGKLKDAFADDQLPLAERAMQEGENALLWVKAMQSQNGGWGAFDRNNCNKHVAMIPFSDFGEIIDPPTADVTAHCLEGLALMGSRPGDSTIDRAISFLKQEQEADGSWFGRWGVNYIYGTSAVLTAAASLGLSMGEAWIQRGAKWLVQHQRDDGGWGESCASYVDQSLRGRNQASVPSQTAWALMGLLAMDHSRYLSQIESGLEWLISNQKQDGTWSEPWYTGTGFPGYVTGSKKTTDYSIQQGEELSRGFMARYQLYSHYFPMMALGRGLRFIEKHNA